VDELRVGILTCSDSRAEGAEDTGGKQLIEACEERGWFVIAYHVCPDDDETITCSLLDMCDAEEADVVFTLGGTSVGPRDVTPEVTERMCDRIVPGIAEAIRDCADGCKEQHVLSRATAGIRGRTLIINLPGGPKPTLKAFGVVEEYLPAAVQRLNEPLPDFTEPHV